MRRKCCLSVCRSASYSRSVWSVMVTSPELSGHVILGATYLRIREDDFRLIVLDQLAHVEEGRVRRDAGRLLHAVGHHHHREIGLQLVDELLDARSGDGIQGAGRL